MSDGRYYGFRLYPSSESYSCDEVLEDIKGYFNEWSYCLHDCDVDSDTGELMKAHYHVYCCKRSSVRLQTIVNRYTKFGLHPQDIEFIRSYSGAIQYLVHLNHLDKFQYSIDSIVTNIIDINKYFEKRPEPSIVLEFVDDRLKGMTYRQIIEKSVRSGNYAVFRRNLGIINLVVQEEFGRRISALDFKEVDVMDI